MSILYIDLKEKKVETVKDRKESGYYLLKALSDEKKDRIVFLSIAEEAMSIKGANNALFSYYDPLKDKIAYSYSPLQFPFVLSNLGYTALILDNRSDSLSYVSLRGDKIEIKESPSFLRHDEFKASCSLKDDDIVASTSIAAEEGIKISAFYENGREIGRCLGYAFSILNLKGIVVQNLAKKRTESSESKKYVKDVLSSDLSDILKRSSTSYFVKSVEERGALSIDNFKRRRDRRAIFLDGSYLKEKVGVYSSSCLDCPLLCKRILQDGSDAPSLIDVIALGSMQDIFSSDKVLSLKKAVYEKGLDTIEAGAMIALSGLSFEKKLDLIKTYKGEDYPSYKTGGHSLLFDPRGQKESALFLSLGDLNLPLFTLYGKRDVKDEHLVAVFAIYERALRYALTNKGLPFLGSYVAYIYKMPLLAYHSVSIFKIYIENLTLFSFKAEELLREGLEIINNLKEENYAFDDLFLYSTSSKKELSTLNITKLKEYYKTEKRRLELRLFKKVEKIKK